MNRSSSRLLSGTLGRIDGIRNHIRGRRSGRGVLAGAAVLLGGASPDVARAAIDFTATLTDVSCSYTPSTPVVGALSMRAVNTGLLQSSYEFRRLASPSGSAGFVAGFVSDPHDPADIVVDLNIVRINSTIATASGTMVLTDQAGNTVTCELSGNVTTIGSLYFQINGNISGLRFNVVSGQQSRFQGNDGSFELEDAVCANPLVGSMNIQILRSGAPFFTSPFSDRAGGGNLQIIGPLVRPCPGDFNCDGGTDGSDIGAFFTSWEAGRVSADINQDGGVDGSDIAAFFEHWEAGC